MIQMGSQVHIIDNSGGKLGNCITVLGGKRFGTIGDVITLSIRKVTKTSQQRKVVAGKVYRGLVVQTVKERRRNDGSYVRFPQNAVILLNQSNNPVGTRIKSAIPRELRNSEFLKSLSLGSNLI